MDGVRTFFVPTDQTPFASLSFRVGTADETLATHGWTHLVEHLAMHDLDNPRIQANASVGLCTTDFYVSGEPQDVVEFLNALCHWLTEPQFPALGHERDVLAAESQRRDAGLVGQHLDLRYGPVGVGLVPYLELGLRTAGADELRSWARRWFTAGNASLAMNCAPLDGLRLGLPDGALQPIPKAENLLPGVPPMHAQGASAETAVSGLVTDSVLANVVASVLEEEIARDLRHGRAVSYGTQGTVTRVDADRLLLLLASDVVPDHQRQGVELVANVVRQFLATGGERNRILAIRDLQLRNMRDDPFAFWQAISSSATALRGGSPLHEKEVLQRLGDLTTAHVVDQVAQFWDSALLTSPAGVDSRTTVPFTTGVVDVAVPVHAQVFKSRLAPADDALMHLSDEALVLVGARRDVSFRRLGVRLKDAAALLVYPDGARQVVSRFGTQLMVEPNLWRHSDQLVDSLDQLVPADRHIPMEARGGDQVPGSAPSVWTWARAQVRWSLAMLRRVIWTLSIIVLVATVLGLKLVLHLSGAAQDTVSTDVLEQATARAFTQSIGTDVEVDCHGAEPKMSEVVDCTVVWGPMRRSAVAQVSPFVGPDSVIRVRVLSTTSQGDQLTS